MSSLGRPNPSIDLVNILNDRVQTLEDNIGEPTTQDTEASGLNLDVEVLKDDVLILQDQVGSDDIDPKTGIFLRLFDIEKADTIIPHYDIRGL